MYAAITTAMTTERMRSSISVRSQVPAMTAMAPTPRNGIITNPVPFAPARCSQSSHPLETMFASERTTMACSTLVREAMKGTASSGPPIPETPLTV
jgi:hypothetical protein